MEKLVSFFDKNKLETRFGLENIENNKRLHDSFLPLKKHKYRDHNKAVLSLFFYEVFNIYIKDWTKYSDKLKILDENKIRKINKVLGSINIGYEKFEKKEYELEFSLSVMYLKRNNLEEELVDKDVLKFLSPSLLVKTFFLSKEEIQRQARLELQKFAEKTIGKEFEEMLLNELPILILSFLKEDALKMKATE